MDYTVAVPSSLASMQQGILPSSSVALAPSMGSSLRSGGNVMGSMVGGMGVMGMAQMGRAPMGSVVSGGAGSVLLVNKLPIDDAVTPDALFTLFGVYGDVIRVKILWNKRDTALIQMATSQHAQVARQQLDKIDFFGAKISVNTSKHSEVGAPNAEGESSHLTKDYSGSKIHRFRGAPGRHEKNAAIPPSHVLHVSNIPVAADQESVQALFQNDGVQIDSLEIFGEEGKKMAYLWTPSIDHAVRLLVKIHNRKVGDRYIRASFARKK